MNEQQAGEINILVKQVRSFDLTATAANAFPGDTNLESILIGSLTLPEFFGISTKVFSILEEHTATRENFITLPAAFYTVEMGNMPVINQLVNYQSGITNLNFVAAENALLFLAQYLRAFNIYDRPARQQARLADQLQTLAAQLEMQKQNIDVIKEKALTVYQTLEKTNADIQAFSEQKREELNSITTSLQTANTQTGQINDLLTKSVESYTRIASYLETQQQNQRAAETANSEMHRKYLETNTLLEQTVITANTYVHEFAEQTSTHKLQVEYVESKKAFFEERINYLQELIGREVGASLFETFKQRKVELAIPLQFWRWAVPLMAVGTIIWISYLFSNQPISANMNEWWEAFAVNSLKSIPAVLLLLFAINQYRKERNFQEEYAFKSAVALTIDAYADRILDPANKDKLIMEAVFTVYKTPIEDARSKIKNKTIMDMAKSLVQTAAELRGVK